MVKIAIDHDLCTGCGTCAELCPEVFEVRDDKSYVIKEECDCNLEEVAQSCPSEAIKLG